MDLSFYHGKRVLVTGHTGFKGSWLVRMLLGAGAEVCGYALEPPTDPSLFVLTGDAARIRHEIGDVRDYEHLSAVFAEFQPEIVIHMAAQPLVRESYREPRLTYETNVMGTVNVCECVRHCPSVRSFLNVTTDKVYRNLEREEGYREDEVLDGYDPYSNSKSCSELVTAAYVRSFFTPEAMAAQAAEAGAGETRVIAVSTARAGNVIGGGDFAKDRLIPDCIRAVYAGKEIAVRNPHSVRPYQHVLDPLYAYLLICARQWEDPSLAGHYNIGPDDADCLTTGEMADLFCEKWNAAAEGTDAPRAAWKDLSGGLAFHESGLLKLDSTLAAETFGRRPVWNTRTAVEKIVEWTRVWLAGGDVARCMDEEIDEFLKTEAN
ncbi:MAG: CDP-glucose 4,6-dehydratase [Lachnospiraceae bacterium]|nr:CDP-glucose 4,6-dehydratase [Lachnospiraceae bacterium]